MLCGAELASTIILFMVKITLNFGEKRVPLQLPSCRGAEKGKKKSCWQKGSE